MAPRQQVDLEEFLRTLRREGPSDGPSLSRRLMISRRVLSSLTERAGERVCRMGRTRAMRYAATRLLEGVGRNVAVHRIAERGAVQAEGRLWMLEGGGQFWERTEGEGHEFVGLPPFAVDMAPQGFLGRGFSQR